MAKITDLDSRRPKANGTVEKELARAQKLDRKSLNATVKGVEEAAGLDQRAVDRLNITRERSAFSLFTHGATFAEIAVALNFESEKVVQLLIDRALGRIVDNSKDRNKMRAKINAQLEEMVRSCMPRATDPTDPEHLAYVRMASLLMERVSKLNGLDAPSVHLINPSEDELGRFIAAWAEATGNEPAPDVDIFELSPGPDGIYE